MSLGIRFKYNKHLNKQEYKGKETRLGWWEPMGIEKHSTKIIQLVQYKILGEIVSDIIKRMA